jgi:hypothetical protein
LETASGLSYILVVLVPEKYPQQAARMHIRPALFGRSEVGTVSEEKLMRRAATVILLGTCLLSTAGYATGILSLANSAAAMGANDFVTWGQLGVDGAMVGNTFSATSSALDSVTGAFSNTTGIVVTAGGSTWGPASGIFINGDSLIWSFDGGANSGTGPLTISFPTGYGAGAAIQADAMGQFTAQIQLYNGLTLLGTESATSDSAGDAIFIGAVDTVAEVTRAIFGLTAAGTGSGSSNNMGDFAIDTLRLRNPAADAAEPGSIFLLGGALAILGYYLRRRARNALVDKRQFYLRRTNTFMKKAFVSLVCGIACVSFAMGQEWHGYTSAMPIAPQSANTSFQPTLTVPAIPMWMYSTTASAALGGGSYSGRILGRSPFDRGKTTTTVPVQIIPLVITINNGSGDSVTYDPTAIDPCISPGAHTDVDMVVNSPLFTNSSWTMNGVSLGDTQFIDAFQRAEFWSLVGGSAYHLLFSPSTLAAQSLSFGSSGVKGPGTNYNAATQFGGCGNIGVVNQVNLDNAIVSLLTGPLASVVNAGTFPIFLTRNVVMARSGSSMSSNCCILGYHAGYISGVNLQIYAPLSLSTAGVFGADITAMSHEMAEAVNDPTGANPTPSWGNLGQTVGSCQSDLEVGDPLSPGFGTPSAGFTISGANGLTYHLQELAFYSWFYGGTSGAGGKYSSNGSFGGSAKLCPGGGTN